MTTPASHIIRAIPILGMAQFFRCQLAAGPSLIAQHSPLPMLYRTGISQHECTLDVHDRMCRLAVMSRASIQDAPRRQRSLDTLTSFFTSANIC